MGERTFIRLQLLKKVYPIRKIVIAASTVFVFLSFLIVLESAFILSANTKGGSPFLVIFSYVLAWLLVAIGLFGLKVGILSQNLGHHRASTGSRPNSAPVWVPSPEPDPELVNFTLPGSVQTTTVEVLYPPPPPRYSSLSNSAVLSGDRLARPPITRPATSPISSPPPPYLPTSGLPIR
uniref:Uncharacterized protein n=1 Tax=Panagrolaimus superbus TaxID=310955 RepID=A0A914YX02_9BILA